MYRLNARKAGLGLVVVGGLLSACQDKSPTAPGAAAARQADPSAAHAVIEHPGEAAFEEISNTVPSFAAFFLEGDNVVVLLTDLSQAPAAEAAVRRTFADQRPGAADLQVARPVLARAARYSFRELRDWRDRILQQVLVTLPDAASIDLDEAGNQVVVGLADGSGRADVERALARLGVDREAVNVEVTGRAVPNERLWDPVRPLRGGLGNGATFDGAPRPYPWCTYSFNARYNGVDVILTASHCTSRTYGTDPTPTVFYQGSLASEDRVGSEWHDPPYITRLCNPQGIWPLYNCIGRYSDAAMIRLDAAVSFDLGFIARTTSRSVTWGVDGSKTIDAQNLRFRIIQSRSYPFGGERVDKIGWRTGWTSGIVRNTCVDAIGSTDGLFRFCTYRADYWADIGDSGSPVFVWSGSGDNVTLVGVHWGRGDDASDISPMGGLYDEFGPMTVEKPLLSVNTGGPSLIETAGEYTWEAFPSGGLESYTYKWWAYYFVSGQLDSLGTERTQNLYVSPPICGNFEMGVRVTSGAETATATHYVNTYTSGCGGGEKRWTPGLPMVRNNRARSRG